MLCSILYRSIATSFMQQECPRAFTQRTHQYYTSILLKEIEQALYLKKTIYIFIELKLCTQILCPHALLIYKLLRE